jgi:formate-dependent nitrite reductase membrane component NrfD
MTFQDISFWLLAAALIIHTIAEAWLPEWEKVKPNWQAIAILFDFLTVMLTCRGGASCPPSKYEAFHLGSLYCVQSVAIFG